MSLHLTPELLEQTYELLRGTPPFSKWKLPHSDDVEFHVVRFESAYGDHLAQANGTPRIRICAKRCDRLFELLLTMAHEMTHLHQRRTDGPKDSAPHGPKFKRLASQVCKRHGFDPEIF